MDETDNLEKLTSAEKSDKSLVELELEYLQILNQFIKEKPERFQEIICHSVLRRDWHEVAADGLLFAGANDGLTQRIREKYSYFADLLLRKSAGQTSLPSTTYITLAQWIEDDARLESRWVRVTFSSRRVIDIWREFFDEHEGALSYAVALTTHFVYQGVPIYRYDAVKQCHIMVERNEPLFHYLYGRGEAFDVVDSSNLPDWASTLYFSQDELRWHRVLFSSMENDDRAQMVILRDALLKQIGLPSWGTAPYIAVESKWPWGEYETLLLIHLAEAAKKWWCNFDPSDNTTAPTNEQVSDWLFERGISRRIADVIATILRADRLPTGPRTSS